MEDVILHQQEGEAFLLHVPTGRYFGLNRTGLVVWNALAAGQDPVARLAEQWPDVPADVRERDASTLIDALVEAELVRRTASPSEQ